MLSIEETSYSKLFKVSTSNRNTQLNTVLSTISITYYAQLCIQVVCKCFARFFNIFHYEITLALVCTEVTVNSLTKTFISAMTLTWGHTVA
jgi:hypothetical protein